MNAPERLVLYGFDHSTYVRTVRMLLAAKGAAYEQVPVDVPAGEPRAPRHLARHAFGKVPVLEHGDLRVIETSAIVRYLDAALPGPSFVPVELRDRARMDMAICLIDAYGYGALIGRVAAFHLFPALFGGVSDAQRVEGIARSRAVLAELVRLRGDSPWLAGDDPGLADFYLAPICHQVGLVPDAAEVFDVPGFAPWWARVRELDEFRATDPG